MGVPRTKSASGAFLVERGPTPLVRLLLAGCTSPNTRRSYAKAVDELGLFLDYRPLTPLLLLEWRAAMADRLAAATVNVRLAAVRQFVRLAQKRGELGEGEALELIAVGSVPNRGSRAGNWLTVDQVKRLLQVPDRTTLRGKRNYCILALLIGCALRRYELAELDVGKIQKRDDRWVIVDLAGKGGRVRTVAIPGWVKQGIDGWTRATGIGSGRLIRQLTLKPAGLSAYAIWEIVNQAAASIGVLNVGPHDLRRTCAKLCRRQGGELEQIRFMLGHQSIQTTERYLGATQDLQRAVNDEMGL